MKTLWSGKFIYQDGKIAPQIIGNQTPPVGALGPEDLLPGSIIQTTQASTQRFNAVRMQLATCRQSLYNGPIAIDDQVNAAILVPDTEEITEVLAPAAYINDFWQLQAVARTRSLLHAIRRTGVIETYLTPGRGTWKTGDGITLTIPDCGLTAPTDFNITQVIRRGNYSIRYLVEERPPDNPWAIPAGANFDDFTEGFIPSDEFRGIPSPPINIQHKRTDQIIAGEPRSHVQTTFDQIPDTDFRVQSSWRIAVAEDEEENDWRDPVFIQSGATQEVEALADIEIRLRYVIAQAEDFDDLFALDEEDLILGRWSDATLLETTHDDATTPEGVGFTPAVRGCVAYWNPATFPGYKATRLIWREVIGENNIVERGRQDVNGGGYFGIPNLEPNTLYQCEVRHLNKLDQASDAYMEDDALPTFRTLAAPAAGSTFFDRYVTQVVQVGETVDIDLPDAMGTPPHSYRHRGHLPTGLAYRSAHQDITGTVASNTQGVSSFYSNWQALNQAGEVIADTPVILTVRPPAPTAPVVFDDADRITGHYFTRGQAITAFMLPTATGPASITYELLGNLTAGLTERTGRFIGGTPANDAASETRLTYRAYETGNRDNFDEVLIFINTSDIAQVAPGIPERVRNSTTNTDRFYLEVEWNASETTGAGTAEWYQWRYRTKPASEAAGQWNYGPQLAPVGLKSQIPNLTPGTRYEVEMRAGNPAGQSEWGGGNQANNWRDGVIMNTLSRDDLRPQGGVRQITGKINVALAADTFRLPQGAGGTGVYLYTVLQKPAWAEIDTDTRYVTGTPNIDGLQSQIIWQIEDQSGQTVEVSIVVYIEPAETAARTFPQTCYVLHAANAGSVGDLNSELEAEDATQRKRADYLPGAAFNRLIPDTTEAKPNAWELSRIWSTNADLITDWEYRGIIKEHPAATTVAPVKPVFASQVSSKTVNINTLFSYDLPQATITSDEDLEYVLNPGVPSPLTFTATGDPPQPRVSGRTNQAGGSPHTLLCRVADDHTRFAVHLFYLNVYSPPDFGNQQVPDQ